MSVLGGCAGDENPGKSTHPRSFWCSHLERRRVFRSHEMEHEWMGADAEVKASLRRALSAFFQKVAWTMCADCFLSNNRDWKLKSSRNLFE